MQYICPTCQDKLEHQTNPVREKFSNGVKNYWCKTCQKNWPIQNGIPNFSEHSFYWNQIPKEKMKELNKVAQKEGWLEALKKILLPETDEYTFRYLVNESRADWHFMLALKKNISILDLGSSGTGISLALARHYNEVIACDSTRETLEFLKIRKKQEGIKNLEVVQIDSLDFCKLPFPVQSLDLIVVNGVLEWVSGDDLIENPCQIQIKLLKKLKTLLKPNGIIYLGIENRFAYSYFLAAPDHSGLKFTSLMPRFMANFYSKMRGNKKGYRTYTYSYWGYKKLLKKAGFGKLKFLYPFPSYRDPEFIVRAEDKEALDYFFKEAPRFFSRWKGLLMRWAYLLKIEKIFMPSFGIIAS